MTQYYKVNNAEEFDWLMEYLEETTEARWYSGGKPTTFKSKNDVFIFDSEAVVVRDNNLSVNNQPYDKNKMINVSDLQLEYEQNKALQTKFDPVEKPSHYNQGKYEVIDVIEDWELGFHEGNVVKYIARHKHKENSFENLKKARYYLDRLIEGEEECTK